MTRNWEDLFQDGQWLTGRTVVQLKAMEADITTALAGGTVVTDGVTIDTNGSGAIEVKTAGVTDAQVAAANKDGAAATPSLRTLGTGATQAAAGNDSRLSDSRTPTGAAGGSLAGTYPNPSIASGAVTTTQIADGTIVNADISASAAIAKSKLAALAIVDADIAAGAAISKSKLASTTYRKTTAKTVNTTVAATDLLNGEITIAASQMGVTGIIRLTAWGDWMNNSGATVAAPRFQVVFGGTTLLDTGASGTNVSGVTRNSWRVVVEIENLGAANSQMSYLSLRMMVNGALTQVQNTFTTGEGILTSVTASGQVIFGEGINPSSAIDTSVARALVLNVVNGSASASYETKLFGAIAELL